MLSILVIIRMLSGDFTVTEYEAPGVVQDCPGIELAIKESLVDYEGIKHITVVCEEQDYG